MSTSQRSSGVDLQQVLNAARVGFWEWEVAGDRLRVDDRLAGWLGARPASMAAYRALTRDRQHREDVDRYRIRERWIEERSLPSGEGRVVGACLDVTHRHRRELTLTWEAKHDAVTGLLSRRCFDRVLEQAVAPGGGGEVAVSLLMMDFDDFKAVNDRLGHAVGDQVLATVARRLRGAVRGTDPVARWGGDEFAVLLVGSASGIRAGRVAERLLAASRQPVALEVAQVALRASIGLVTHRPGEDPRALSGRADRALYAAKRAGGDRWCSDGPPG